MSKSSNTAKLALVLATRATQVKTAYVIDAWSDPELILCISMKTANTTPISLLEAKDYIFVRKPKDLRAIQTRGTTKYFYTYPTSGEPRRPFDPQKNFNYREAWDQQDPTGYIHEAITPKYWQGGLLKIVKISPGEQLDGLYLPERMELTWIDLNVDSRRWSDDTPTIG